MHCEKRGLEKWLFYIEHEEFIGYGIASLIKGILGICSAFRIAYQVRQYRRSKKWRDF